MPAARAEIAVKRVYEKAAPSDGFRVLVDRLWPRGLKKDEARIDAWLADLAPSNELRKWFHANTEQWAEFRKRYDRELRTAPAQVALDRLKDLLSKHDRVTLLFASKNTDRNNAIVLREFIQGMK